MQNKVTKYTNIKICSYCSWDESTKTVKTKTRTANAIRKSVAWIFRLNFFNIKNKVSGEQRIDIFCNFASFYGII